MGRALGSRALQPQAALPLHSLWMRPGRKGCFLMIRGKARTKANIWAVWGLAVGDNYGACLDRCQEFDGRDAVGLGCCRLGLEGCHVQLMRLPGMVKAEMRCRLVQMGARGWTGGVAWWGGHLGIRQRFSD